MHDLFMSMTLQRQHQETETSLSLSAATIPSMGEAFFLPGKCHGFSDLTRSLIFSAEILFRLATTGRVTEGHIDRLEDDIQSPLPISLHLAQLAFLINEARHTRINLHPALEAFKAELISTTGNEFNNIVSLEGLVRLDGVTLDESSALADLVHEQLNNCLAEHKQEIWHWAQGVWKEIYSRWGTLLHEVVSSSSLTASEYSCAIATLGQFLIANTMTEDSCEAIVDPKGRKINMDPRMVFASTVGELVQAAALHQFATEANDLSAIVASAAQLASRRSHIEDVLCSPWPLIVESFGEMRHLVTRTLAARSRFQELPQLNQSYLIFPAWPHIADLTASATERPLLPDGATYLVFEPADPKAGMPAYCVREDGFTAMAIIPYFRNRLSGEDFIEPWNAVKGLGLTSAQAFVPTGELAPSLPHCFEPENETQANAARQCHDVAIRLHGLTALAWDVYFEQCAAATSRCLCVARDGSLFLAVPELKSVNRKQAIREELDVSWISRVSALNEFSKIRVIPLGTLESLKNHLASIALIKQSGPDPSEQTIPESTTSPAHHTNEARSAARNKQFVWTQLSRHRDFPHQFETLLPFLESFGVVYAKQLGKGSHASLVRMREGNGNTTPYLAKVAVDCQFRRNAIFGQATVRQITEKLGIPLVDIVRALPFSHKKTA